MCYLCRFIKNLNVRYKYNDNGYDELGVAGFEYQGAKYYYVKNLQGDIIEILNSNNQVVASYIYDAWGIVYGIHDGQGNDVSNNSNHIANINPYRYRGYYYDIDTQLYYLNSRYYNPEIGRFINSDFVLGANEDILSYNLYAYCSNNPINMIDPDGEDAIVLFQNQPKWFGDMGLLVQNNKGEWYFYLFMSEGVIFKPVNMDKINNFGDLNKALGVGSKYYDSIYLIGNYTKTFAYCQARYNEYKNRSAKNKNKNPKYNLLFNNCGQSVIKALSAQNSNFRKYGYIT